MVKIEKWDDKYAHHLSPEELQCARNADHAWAVSFGEDLVAVVGVEIYSIGSNTAFVWMIPLPAVKRHKVGVARASIQFFAEAKKVYSKVYGVVQCDNLVSQQWLRWLGFQIVPSEHDGIMYFVEKA